MSAPLPGSRSCWGGQGHWELESDIQTPQRAAGASEHSKSQVCVGGGFSFESTLYRLPGPLSLPKVPGPRTAEPQNQVAWGRC